MPYVHRNARGEIESLHRSATLDATEYLPQSSEEVQRFLGREVNADAYARLDADLVRVLEDLVYTLAARGVLRVTDLPPAAQAKLFARQAYRERETAPSPGAPFAPSGFVDIIDDSTFAALGAPEVPPRST
jgi:hypothetical protein